MAYTLQDKPPQGAATHHRMTEYYGNAPRSHGGGSGMNHQADPTSGRSSNYGAQFQSFPSQQQPVRRNIVLLVLVIGYLRLNIS